MTNIKQKPEQFQDMLARLFPDEFTSNESGKRNLVKTLTLQVTDACNLYCHYCVTGDTGIITPNMINTPISEIIEGMNVLAFSPYLNQCINPLSRYNTFFTKVTKIMKRRDNVFKVSFDDGKSINITEDHPIKVSMGSNEFMTLKQGLNVGDKVYALNINLADSNKINKDIYHQGFLMACADYTRNLTLTHDIRKENIEPTVHLVKMSRRERNFNLLHEDQVDYRIGYLDACKIIYDIDPRKTSTIKFNDVYADVSDKITEYMTTLNPEVRFSYSDSWFENGIGFFNKHKSIERLTITAFQTTRIKMNACKTITKIESLGEMDVYNLETEAHTYFANNVAVHNCYQINKGTRIMDFEIAKKAIDLVLEEDNPRNHYFSSKTSPGIILEFIGGEPLLQIDLIDRICDYFYMRCIELRHKWVNRFRISMCSNGTLYFDDKVQIFMKKWKDVLSFSITIDGNKELHDACRVFENGEGSYDIAVKAALHYSENYGYMGSKLTIAPENIQYLSGAVIHMIELGYTEINANCVYEEGWNDETAEIYLEQLMILASYWKHHNLFDTHYISLFDSNIGKPMPVEDNSNWCGGTGYMMAVDPDGKIFPCIRYMESSLGTDIEPIVIGNVDDGIGMTEKDFKVIDTLDSITRRSQSSDDCFYCPVASGCAWCSAYNYQHTGSVNKRATNICLMHKIRCYANTLFWNLCNDKFDVPYSDVDVYRITSKVFKKVANNLFYPFKK